MRWVTLSPVPGMKRKGIGRILISDEKQVNLSGSVQYFDKGAVLKAYAGCGNTVRPLELKSDGEGLWTLAEKWQGSLPERIYIYEEEIQVLWTGVTERGRAYAPCPGKTGKTVPTIPEVRKESVPRLFHANMTATQDLLIDHTPLSDSRISMQAQPVHSILGPNEQDTDTIEKYLDGMPPIQPFAGALAGARFARIDLSGVEEGFDHYIVGKVLFDEQTLYMIGIPEGNLSPSLCGLQGFDFNLTGTDGQGYWVKYIKI